MVKAGIVSTARIEKEIRAVIMATCPTVVVDYIAFSDFATLRPTKKVVKGTICSLAVRVYGVRLIDNFKLL